MNTDRLVKLYDRLTPRERLPLIIAAGVRGDTTEQHHLSGSAPEVCYRVPDYYPLAKAMGEMEHFYQQTLLDLAAKFWQWWGAWMTYTAREAGAAQQHKRRRRRANADFLQEWRAYGITRYYASRFVAYIDGWKQFCAELKVDPEVNLKLMIGRGTIIHTEEAARELAFPPEEAAWFVRQETVPIEGDGSRERRPVSVETMEELAAGWHIILDHLVCQEGG